jgi:poly(3-hydroxybutyrate) depolymerase
MFKKFNKRISSITCILSLVFLQLFYSCSSKVEESAADNQSSSSSIQSFKINQSWSQKPDGYERNVFYKYPENGNNNNPVAILLHGAGGTPQIR